MPVRDPWTTILVIIVSITATVIGYRNLEWALNAVDLIDTMPSKSDHRIP
jgi:hypothetical protein